MKYPLNLLIETIIDKYYGRMLCTGYTIYGTGNNRTIDSMIGQKLNSVKELLGRMKGTVILNA